MTLMAAEVPPALEPNMIDMRKHVDHLFGGYLDGHHDDKIELAWTKTTPDEAGRYRLSYARFYGTDEVDDLVVEAARLSAIPMCNVYIGAALRKPDTPPMGRAQDDDFGAALTFWCDLDSADAVRHALSNYADAKPTMLVMTGSHPDPRIQCWWRLAEAVDDPDRLRNALSGIAYKMGGDTTVTNPSRVMRLAGTIAWPHKEHRVAELTRIVPLKDPGLAEYFPDHLEQVFPPIYSLSAARDRRQGHDGGDGTITRATSATGLTTGKVVDGRDAYMLRLICAHLLEFVGTTGAEPTMQELFDEAWPVYREKADLTRAGHGQSAFEEKCAYAIRRFAAGQIRGMRTVEEAVAAWQRKSAASAAYKRDKPFEWTEKPAPATAIDIAGELEWFDDIQPVTSSPYVIKSVIDQGAMSVVYGASNSGKTFFALDLAFHVATGAAWRDLRVVGGSVLYLAAEGGNGIANRIVGLRTSTGILDVPLALRRAGLDLLRPDADTARVIALAKEVEKRRPLKLMVIDTLSRVLAGGDENGPVDMTAFIKNVDRIREATGAHVMIVHHTGKDAARGARGHSSLRAATDTEIEVSVDEESGERNAKATKQREHVGGEEWRFRLKQLDLGKDQDGDAVTTCTVSPILGQRVADDNLPPMAICRQMLNAIHEAWLSGNPLTVASNMKSSGRYAVRVLSMQFKVDAAKVEKLLIGWIDSATIAVEVVNSDSKKRGLKVLKWLD